MKHSAGLSTHRECGATGYENVQPTTYARPPVVERGATHVLRADLEGSDLRVMADGIPVWQGRLPAVASSLEGPAGFRSDNGAFDVELRVPQGLGPRGVCP